jgi:transposase
MAATKPVDFRKSHDGLAALVKNELRKDRNDIRLPLAKGRSAEADLLGRQWHDHGLQAAGGAQLHVSGHQAQFDGTQPRPGGGTVSRTDWCSVRAVAVRAP